jgi:hypothetical protein
LVYPEKKTHQRSNIDKIITFYYTKLINFMMNTLFTRVIEIFPQKRIAIIFLYITVSTLYPLHNSYSTTLPQDPGGTSLLRVFLDFPFFEQYVRESIIYVNYVRDRELSQIHIMMTRHFSGTAGANYVISFIGRGRFDGMNNVITYWAPGTATSDEIRRGLVSRINMGLVPYIASTDLAGQISLSINGDRPVERIPVEDPWKSWVFEIYGGANIHREEKQNRFDSRWGFAADKVTDDWKIRFRPYFNLSERNFLTTDDRWITSRTHRHGLQSSIVKSIDQHWSAGIFVNMLSSTFHNLQFNISGRPGMEYSFFPYSEATSKAITLVYTVGGGYNNYIEETIFLKTSEYLASQALTLSVAFQQPWGSFRARLSGSHHFHDFTSNRAEFFARLDFRIVKGLSLNLSGNFDYINDLVSLPAGDLSLEEILLQQRRQATNYQLAGSIGISYSFGSQFSNVVNTRF